MQRDHICPDRGEPWNRSVESVVLFPSVGWDSDYVTVAGKSVGTLYATSPAGVSPTMIVSLRPSGRRPPVRGYIEVLDGRR